MQVNAHPTERVQFWTDGQPMARADQWQASQHSLGGLLDNPTIDLTPAVAQASLIHKELDRLVSAMVRLCRRTCRFCPEPCCITNTVWFDFRDLLLLHLSGGQIPPVQAISDPGRDCPYYLSHRGCRLPATIRPWMCLKYICPTQRSRLDRKRPSQMVDLLAAIESIENRRTRMEVLVIRQIKRKRRKGPSSSSACCR